MQNKNLRKALAVSMAIAMTGGLLAGCGNSSSGGSSQQRNHKQRFHLIRKR